MNNILALTGEMKNNNQELQRLIKAHNEMENHLEDKIFLLLI